MIGPKGADGHVCERWRWANPDEVAELVLLEEQVLRPNGVNDTKEKEETLLTVRTVQNIRRKPHKHDRTSHP